MHYLRNWVLAAFRAGQPNDTNPSEATLDAFDQDQFHRFDAEIVAQAPGPLTLFEKSILMYFATRSPALGANAKVADAYDFFNATNPTP